PAGVGVNPKTNRVYVGNTLGRTISVIDGTTNMVIDTVLNVSNGYPAEGGSIAVNANTNLIYVTQLPFTVVIIDGASDKVTGTLNLQVHGEISINNIAVNPSTNTLYATGTGYNELGNNGPSGNLIVVDLNTNTM